MFPSMLSIGSRSELEEERRLFYVALTRAKKRAHLTYTHTRYRWGKLIDCEPSRFIDEIDEKFLDIKIPEFSPTSFSSPALDQAFGGAFGGSNSSKVYRGKNKDWGKKSGAKSDPPQKSTAPTLRGKALKPVQHAGVSYEANGDHLRPEELSEGMRVVHGRFGLGTVKILEGQGADAKAIIAFDNAGEKRLLLKFAKVKAV